jgi:cellulose synthase/poly-beta-1,6-N-acetylglucosamine synthase-like glycosyltransferase
MVQQFSNPDVDMVTGWVKIEPDKRFFSKLQAFEFLSLAATGATSVIADSPLMCNGANLAYRKRVFTEQGGFSYGSESPSGDDTFLMLAVAKSGRGKVVFCNNPEATVSTKPLNDWRAFIFQRIRWGGKVKHYREKYIGRYGLLIFMANLMLLLLPLMALAGKVDVAYAITLWSFKVFADMLLLMKAANFSKQQHLLWLFLPASIFYPLYAVAGSLLSMIPVQYEWKNRKW